MNRQRLLYRLLAISMSLDLLVSVLERISSESAEFSVYVAFAGFVGMLATALVALLNFRKESNATNRHNAILIATLPFAVWLLLYLFDTSANVHGVALPVLFLYFAISEILALVLFIALAVRALRS